MKRFKVHNKLNRNWFDLHLFRQFMNFFFAIFLLEITESLRTGKLNKTLREGFVTSATFTQADRVICRVALMREAGVDSVDIIIDWKEVTTL